MKIETNNKNIEIRSVDFEDVTNRFNLVVENIPHLEPWLEWVDFYKDESAVTIFTRFCLEEVKLNKKHTFMIYYDNKFAGGIDIQKIDNEDRPIEIGYWLGKEFTGKGIMKDCVLSVTKFIFENYSRDEILIKAEVDNDPSKKVALNSGYEYKKTLYDAHKKREVLCDLDVFEMTRERFNSINEDKINKNKTSK
ncbi:MAG: GNAT family protein [bacterium]